MRPSELPPLDAHAHIAPDVTPTQVHALEPAVVFAMTRSLKEAHYAHREDAAFSPRLVWGIGAHPGAERALSQFDNQMFQRTLPQFALIGEVGLDRRGDRQAQAEVFQLVLQAAVDQPVLISAHSTGRCTAVLDQIEESPHPGVLLHWFNGTDAEIRRAARLGCFFSVNAAMSAETLSQIPLDRLLTETDFPSARARTGASKPGDVGKIEYKLEEIYGPGIRAHVWRNLAELTTRSGAKAGLRRSRG
jgi:TatD DNase family protein